MIWRREKRKGKRRQKVKEMNEEKMKLTLENEKNADVADFEKKGKKNLSGKKCRIDQIKEEK